MSEKSPNPVDVHVGSRLRMRRMLIGLSQEKLAEYLGLTFQQVQKYEKGSNRISASRLFEIARILKVPIQFFFDDMPDAEMSGILGRGGFADPPEAYMVNDFLASAEGSQLIRAFSGIRNPEVRRRVIELVKSISETD